MTWFQSLAVIVTGAGLIAALKWLFTWSKHRFSLTERRRRYEKAALQAALNREHPPGW